MKKNRNEKNEIVNISHGLDSIFKVSGTDVYNLDINIHVIRIIYQLGRHLKSTQWEYKNNINKYKDKFEEKLRSDHNDFHTFQFKLSEMGKNNNLAQVQQAFDFLSEFNNGWHESRSAGGKKVKTKFAFINNPTYAEGGWVEFRVPLFWMKVLINLEIGFNQSLYTIAFNTSNIKHFYFHIWLLRLPAEGTKIKVSEFQERFSLNYSSNYELDRSFLKKIKVVMDKYSNYSFNYSFELKYLRIAKYANNLTLFSNEISEEEYKEKKRQRLHYLKKRHKLSTEEVKILRVNLSDFSKYKTFEDAYELFKNKAKEQKIKVTEFTGEDFLIKIQNIINWMIHNKRTEITKLDIINNGT